VFTSDADGVASLTLPTGNQSGRTTFNGYLQVTDSDGGAFGQEIVFASPPATQSGSSSTVVVGSLGLAEELASNLGLTIDPTEGEITVTAIDCANRPATNVTFEVEASGQDVRVYYTHNALPSTTATATDVHGTALVANVPTGPVSVTVRSVSLGQIVATAQVFVRASELTLARVAPNL
jgi:hypothetical protein